MGNVLKIENLRKSFGGHTVINDISLSVKRGSLIGIIGPNGAGKSTLLNCILGMLRADRGNIYFNNENITHLKIYEIVRLGISRTFQVPKIFTELSVMENMFAPLLYSSLLNIDITKRARELLTWVGILDKEHAYAKEMSGGQQKLLEFARALMADPEIILFDEPFAGVHPNLKNVMMERMLDLKKMGKTIILVSHDMPSLYMLTQEIIVLHQGAFLARGTPQELKENEEVVSAYLGEGRN